VLAQVQVCAHVTQGSCTDSMWPEHPGPAPLNPPPPVTHAAADDTATCIADPWLLLLVFLWLLLSPQAVTDAGGLTHLFARGAYLTGTLPCALVEEHPLQALYVGYNDLGSGLPECYLKSGSLRELSITGAGLTGEWISSQRSCGCCRGRHLSG
jgi:hypothetical protein